MNNENFKVTSEISPYFEKDIHSKPFIDEKNTVSKFTFSIPGSKKQIEKLKKDRDGDYILERKDKEMVDDYVLYLEHSISTEIPSVGLQIWRAALLLADFLIHFRNSLECKTIIELGSGVGLTSIVAGIFAKKVICTDLDFGDSLRLIRSNVERNKEILKAEVSVLGLNFFDNEFSSEISKELQDVTVVLAADVIYDNDVTQAFVEMITKILSVKPSKELYLALEKRYVFTVSDLDSVAPCYEHLVSCLRSAQLKPPFSGWTLTEIPLDFPQYFNYERVPELIMYKVTT